MLYFHVGLHKTGTTSFQHMCINNREKLISAGLDYPADKDLTLGSEQHLLFARSFGNLINILEKYTFKSGCDILISTEEIVNSIDTIPDEKVLEIFSFLEKKFSGLTILISIRDDVSLAGSLVREYSEGSFFGNIHKFLPNYSRRVGRLFGFAKAYNIRCIDIAKKPKEMSLPSFYIFEGTGKKVDIPDFFAQVTSAKQPLQYFMGAFRIFYAQLLGLDMYNAKINNIYFHDVLENIHIDPNYNERLKLELDKLFASAVEKYFQNNKVIIPEELRSLASTQQS